ncbi:hypothetical protein Hlac_3630 (plasmid) [Halorubrum lacusprofundi ATCC 49239]|jgi:hypothetical protein|uniref:Uncharacterized protein n=1 Tax=Halorubrum lacusprofundi (strain ATCC 49239 / DSM 5036 / JCM 8891 / ACAM 34) TaxID=416348 RepID=B9LXE3_HALLT|nr:hypothetical protein Hlac_3630 [Halorubrum lacusprofundi ATCC 49239]
MNCLNILENGIKYVVMILGELLFGKLFQNSTINGLFDELS